MRVLRLAHITAGEISAWENVFVVTVQSYTEMGNLTLGNEHELCLPHLHGHTVRLFLNQLIVLICNLLTSGYGNKIHSKNSTLFVEDCRTLQLPDACTQMCVCASVCVMRMWRTTCVCVCVWASAGVRAALVWGRGCGCWTGGRVFLMAPEPSLDLVLVLWLVNS